MPEPLPIEAVLPSIAAAVREAGAAVVVAPPGAGKTTRVPPLLRELVQGRIIVLEPRRVAARAAARRMAQELGGEVGGEVGWQVRFDRRAGPDTRILVVTEGVLVRMLQDDPFLEGVGAVVLDEFHERSLDSDLALAMLRRVREEARPELVVVPMSATLEAAPLAAWLGGVPVVESEGRSYPVEIRYLERPDPRPVGERVAAAVRQALREGEGSVLAFLPGVGEILRVAEALEGLGVPVCPLYGDLSPEAQDAALRGGRRVVLATNVAESSVTVEGVDAVVDLGLARILRHDPGTGLDRLEVTPIARDAATQRAGRAGRLGPGRCYRLWTAAEERERRDRSEPEVRRVDLAPVALQLRAWGERDPASFPWFEAPDPAALQVAEATLVALGAVSEGNLNATGRAMAALPVHPRLARLAVEAWRLGHPEAGALAAASLAERDPFPRDDAPPTTPSDVLDRVHRLQERRRERRLAPIWQAQEQLARELRRAMGRAPEPRVEADEAVLRAVFAGWSDRVASRRGASARARVVGGKGVTLAPGSGVREARLFVCVEVHDQPGASEALVRVASAVEEGWLQGVEEAVELAWDASSRRVLGRKLRRWRGLLLDERPVPVEDASAAGEVLAAALLERPELVPWEAEEVAALRARVGFLRRHAPELGLPDLDAESARLEVLELVCAGRRSLDDLTPGRLRGALWERLSWREREAVDREAPERLSVPSGSQVRLHWEADRPPVLAVRMQEMFGCARTPTVAMGRVPVLLHLLAPNGRPQQVTDDLAGFWVRTWPEVRKELRARYPKHSWPDDPLIAPPLRGVKRRD